MSYLEETPLDLIYLISNKLNWKDLIKLVLSFDFLNTAKYWEKFFRKDADIILVELVNNYNGELVLRMIKEWDGLEGLVDDSAVGEMLRISLIYGDYILAKRIFDKWSSKFGLKWVIIEYVETEPQTPETGYDFLLADTYEGNEFRADVVIHSMELWENFDLQMKIIKKYNIRFNPNQMLQLFRKSNNRLALLSFLMQEYQPEFSKSSYVKTFVNFILRLIHDGEHNIPGTFEMLRMLYKLID